MDTDTDANIEQSKPPMPLNTWLVATAVGLLLATGSIALYMELGHPSALEVAASSHPNSDTTALRLFRLKRSRP